MAVNGKVAIIGSGLIGQSWTLVFVSGGYNVQLYDNQPERIESAIKSMKDKIADLGAKGALRGDLTATEQSNLISGASSLSECLENAFWVQECVFEDVQLKRQIFAQLDDLVSDETILASSTSFIPPSQFMETLKHRANALVNHPVNPPYFVPLTELVPSPWTDPETVTKAKKILLGIGQRPIVCKKEVPGFIINRLQDALFAEAYNLIDDDVIDVDDLDAAMSEGLGMRYAFMGPWETGHLNANGMIEYFDKYAPGIFEVQSTFAPAKKMEGPTAQKIIDSMLTKVPMDQLADRRQWRDQMIIRLSQIKRQAQ